jgi:hypothetical protein
LQTTAAALALAIAGTAAAGEPSFEEVDLVSDQPGHAPTIDADLVNAWGPARRRVRCSTRPTSSWSRT